MNILTLTCWSHSIKYHLYCRNGWVLLAFGVIERVALGSSFIRQTVPGRELFSQETGNNNHQSAVALIIAALTDPQHGVIESAGGISAVGHRIVHGGDCFRHSVQIDDKVLAVIKSLQHLAPMHSAPNIAGIEAALLHLPAIPHMAVFDTAFHLSMPESAYRYPLPYDWCEKYGVRRYGFHGPSHLYLSRRGAKLLNKPIDTCNLITIHLDRGVSLCAIRKGLSVDTSMGMTPLEGAVMETRCGDIDPGIHAYMMQEMNLSAQEMEQILNYKSGIAGITGRRRSRQHFLQAALDGDSRSKLALEIEAYRLKKYIGSYLAINGPLDAIVFTSGTSSLEWLLREMVLSGLDCLGVWLDQERNRAVHQDREEVEISAEGSLVKLFIMPANEELVIAEDVAAIHYGVYCDHQHYEYSFASADFFPAASME